MDPVSEVAKNYVFKNGAFLGKRPYYEMFTNHTIIEYMQNLIRNDYDFVTADEKNIYFELLLYYTKLNKNK